MNRTKLFVGMILLAAGTYAMPGQAQGSASVASPGGADAVSAGPWAIGRDGKVQPEWVEPGSPKPKTPPPAGLYVAIGDSITFGYGTTKNCQAFPTHPVDVETFCPNGTSYAVRVARKLREDGIAGHFMNLGISGADVSRVIRDELPLLPAEATLITVYIGTNDSRGTTKYPVETVVKRFETKYAEMLSLIKAKAPKARVVVVNFPNERVLAEELTEKYHTPVEALPRFEAVSQQLDTFIDSHFPEYPVVDTICMPESYRTDLLYRMSVHPDDEGSAILAKAVLKVITAAKPAAPPRSCKWYSGGTGATVTP